MSLEAFPSLPGEIRLDATPRHGDKERRFFHGYYNCHCYLPLYVQRPSVVLPVRERGDGWSGALVAFPGARPHGKPFSTPGSRLAGAAPKAFSRCGIGSRGRTRFGRIRTRRFREERWASRRGRESVGVKRPCERCFGCCAKRRFRIEVLSCRWPRISRDGTPGGSLKDGNRNKSMLTPPPGPFHADRLAAMTLSAPVQAGAREMCRHASNLELEEAARSPTERSAAAVLFRHRRIAAGCCAEWRFRIEILPCRRPRIFRGGTPGGFLKDGDRNRPMPTPRTFSR